MSPLRLATRGSDLALWQANQTASMLTADAEPLVVKSTGDLDQTTALARFGRIGIFTVEVDRAVLDGRAAIGVHSLKDMTTTLQEGVVLAGVLPRGPVEDVLIGSTLEELPHGAKVGTGSMRRRAMLNRLRPDLECVEVRGNVDTRLRKLAEGEASALIMARAGMERLGLAEHISQVLPITDFLPAVGQGIVGLTCRAEDSATFDLLSPFRQGPEWLAANAERSFLRELKGGCNVPAGGHATVTASEVLLRGAILSIDGSECLEVEESGTNPEQLGPQLASRLIAMGGDHLLEAARS